MDPRARALLHDMQQAVTLVDGFTAGKSLQDYLHDPLLRSGIERQMQIIGEALNQLTKMAPDQAARITDYRRIIALRNILVHGYARVDHRVIWNMLEQNLPVLRRDVDDLMRER